MNKPFGPGLTRWQATVDAVQGIVDGQNGYLQGSAFIGLLRFGHDPNAGASGTTIPGDVSQPQLVDGQALDVGFYDVNKAYYHCNGEAVRKAWNPQLGGTVPPPLAGQLDGIESWTKGALDQAYAVFQKSWADHPGELTKRPAAVLLITDGPWTDPSGKTPLAPANQDPALTAGAMYNAHGIPTYVIALGEAKGAAFADVLAASGGTGQASDVGGPWVLYAAAGDVVEDVEAKLLSTCEAGRTRIMVLLDASSSMLNIMGGVQYGQEGLTGWDQARAAIAGNMSLFDQVLNGSNKTLGSVAHVGLAVFGHNMPAPGEQKLVVDYGPCRKENVAWALDPVSSCVAPGCVDPWGGPPITWTFQDGSVLDPPGFVDPTISHMPKCDKSAQVPMACVGSGTYTHLGLQLVDQNLAAYKAKCAKPGAEHPCDAQTKFLNILITDGVYNSTDTQVQVALEGLFAQGVTTYVIGFGDLVATPQAVTKLTNMAAWGSGGAKPYFKAPDQMQLQLALQQIAEGITIDGCCLPYNCQGQGAGCVCGNGVVEGCGDGDGWLEDCDDGNNLDGDGCSAWCILEPGDSSSTGMGTETSGGSTTGGSSTGEGSSTGSSTGGSSSGSSSSSSGGASSSSSSGEVVTTGASLTEGGSGATAGEGASSTAETSGGGGDGDGCGCATGGDEGRGALFGLPLLALLRRRVRRDGPVARRAVVRAGG